ncbi:MAG: hypothetical protein AB1560_11535 [Pseudomonadota bacterium]
MGKLVIKITVYQDADPDLYDSVSNLPLRRRSAVIRRLWRRGLQAGSPVLATPQPEPAAGVPPAGADGATVAADPGVGGAGGQRLRQDLKVEGLTGLSAFV